MNNKIRSTSIAILITSLLFSPLVYIVVFLGMFSSKEGGYFTIMFLGYLGVVLFSILSIFYNKLFIAIFISAIIFATGFALDASFIKNNQDERCKAVRANPTCIEDACGFNCSNSINDESATVCKDKDLNLCKSFRDGQIKF